MTLLQTILEVFHRSLIRIGQEMSFKILHMCVGSYLTPNRTRFFSTICVHKKRFFCVKKLIMILDIMILSTFEHVYIVTQWCLIDFSEMNDNGNVLFEILLLSDKLLVLSNMEITFAADNTAVKQNVAGPNIPLSI